MEFTLAPQTLLQLASISARNTLALLPMGKNKKQKIVVGEDSGCITCFETRKGSPSVIFKTLPTGLEVSALCVGGEVGSKDKIFVANGQQIRGMTKKGKEFFKVVTNLTEVIKSMFVEDTKIWTTGELIYNLFDNGRDVASFMSPDVISSFCVRKITRDTDYDVVLGCRDSRVRVVSGSSLAFELAVDSAVTCVANIAGTPIPPEFPVPPKGFQEIIYTTQRGQMGQLLADSSTIRRGWTAGKDVKNREATVNSVVTADINGDGVDEIIFGRDDGVLAVYGFESGECASMWSQNVGESVRSVAVGEVCTAGYKEVVFATYSGKIGSYTTERMDARDEEDPFGRSKDVVVRETQLAQLRKDLDVLKAKVVKEREKFSKMCDRPQEIIAVEPPFKVNVSQLLEPDNAAYKFSVEIPFPIDVVMLQSQIPVDLLDVDSNVAIISKTKPDRVSKSLLLATYRCQESVNRLEMCARTVEGQYGDIQVTVLANVSPGKTAQIVKFSVKPLSLHFRVYDALDDRVMNTLRFSGPFSISQMHEWIIFLLPDVPSRLPDDEVAMSYKNSFVGTQLLIRYKKGEATFQSDSMSTIAIIKEVLTKQATAKKIRVNMTFDVRDETVASVLRLLHPKLDYAIGLSRKVDLIEALREIKGQSTETEFLTAEYRDVLENSEKYVREMKTQPKALEMLFGLVTDLFVDKHKFKGHNVQHMMPQLMALLQAYDYDAVLAYFLAPPVSA